ncbi:LOW QUALITY PROTEIN: taste receptor type 2 member 114-like [Colossoma macropomum]|uniref:LOW QUALITY PROTEIN: taste receptor type 2 member 114-like n=1 Tax=Colossoma macropomum TaxID=42526 RepID=UPI001865340E|nr:LOW QUALITY PROTEIN: taste receptor type 2 member 114-like [Colossoma macropomum]
MVLNTSWHFSVEMTDEAFASVNVPFSAVSILFNIFFVYCMVVPQQGAEQLKEPLKVLLGSLIGCNITIHFCSLLFVFNEFVFRDIIKNVNLLHIICPLILTVMIYTMMTIVMSSHWKNMFYFCQIVPLQHSFFVWFKRNIRALIYSALILNKIFCLFGMAVGVFYNTVQFSMNLANNFTNDTQDALWNSLQINYMLCFASFMFTLALYMLSLCVMLASSCAVVLYLWRHMKNVEESGLVSPRLQRQIKMTITGITVQALLHFLCSFWNNTWNSELYIFPEVNVDWNGHIVCTIISLYSSGTTINMMVGQSLFRQGVVHVWQKLLQTFNFCCVRINKGL